MCRSRNYILKKYRANYHDKKILEQLIVHHSITPYLVKNYKKNKSNVAFVFSCPGRDELIAGIPCSGTTGKNLDKLLKILNAINSDVFCNTDRYKYDILNATEVVHFEMLGNKTEGKKDEIDDGIKKILKYIIFNKNLSYIILFGEKAVKAKEPLNDFIKNNKRKIFVLDAKYHLGFKSLNRIHYDINNNPIDKNNYSKSYERTNARLKVIADIIMKQLNK